MSYGKKITLSDVSEIFKSTDRELLEKLAREAQYLTRQYFGRTVSLYAPLYISNYCENECIYCGFHNRGNIRRERLSATQIEEECRALAATGIQNILLLTGESRSKSSPAYIKEAVLIAKKYFPSITLEVYPMEEAEYRELFQAGVDGVTMYQETYHREIYDKLHLNGKKKDYNYRLKTPDRIAASGIRYVSLGILLGLAPWQEDIIQLFSHIESLERTYPAAEFSLAFPRIQKLTEYDDYYYVSDADMVKILCCARLFFPRMPINLSTRESAAFRDHVFPLAVTKLSAGSCTTVGGYCTQQQPEKDPQFDISDSRSLAEVKQMLLAKHYDPVFTDWRNIAVT
jgi:2-iminoacetate synthase